MPKECANNEEIEIFMNTIAIVLENYHTDYVINIDETPVRVEQQTQYTIAYKGDITPPIRKNYCPKTIISAICDITLSERKLPITFLAKGKGQVCQRNLNVHLPNITDCTPKGKANTPSCVNMIPTVSNYVNGEPGCLIWDAYGSHWVEEVMEAAEEFGIELVSVPKNTTPISQPLDYGVFGPLQWTYNGQIKKL
ncbi:hypothetical protein TRFO_38417 [Tritrichomonas foetus]|uniref:DDE-1 domain-containing protein n=1 Tax=Tritrichomonas foetus TaxID=1144522 RepID=A0A1J4JDH9_9EUKA|nr:hypothetical protein TRFO_38417 [Tritrichomonas foetus]|eukprot:OHS95493.1 hypothetical protein TRFO_38417 [Tritrichomonas foetus]